MQQRPFIPSKPDKSKTGGRLAQPYRRLRSDTVVDLLVSKHGKEGRAVLPVLQGLAASGQLIGKKVLGATAEATRVHDARVAGLASFYSMLSDSTGPAVPIRICDGPVCMLHGARKVQKAVETAVKDEARWCVGRTSCLGLCDRTPAVLVGLEPCGPLSESCVDAMLDGWRGESPNYGEPIGGEQRVALAWIGQFDPDSSTSTLPAGAYNALEQALANPPVEVLQKIEQSGLRGCGGAGFPTGKKWRMVSAEDAGENYVICNADESEPGAFKDRVLMEGDPHLVLEGMALAAYAVGARVGIIYVRGEYERCALSLERAINLAQRTGWLGDNVAGSSFSFHVHVHRGAGAYICGEETALLESLEGRRGEPRWRPPYPTTHGYFGQPTVVNNVETLCMVPAIVRRGADWYRAIGPAGSPGTKLFTETGHVTRPLLFESPLGITVRDILNRMGLGSGAARSSKWPSRAAQPGH